MTNGFTWDIHVGLPIVAVALLIAWVFIRAGKGR